MLYCSNEAGALRQFAPAAFLTQVKPFVTAYPPSVTRRAWENEKCLHNPDNGHGHACSRRAG